METFYTLLNISREATTEEIQVAYQQQRERYTRLAALDSEFQHIAESRIADIYQAYTVLIDPDRRCAYDHQIDGTTASVSSHTSRRTGVSQREAAMAGVGIVIGLLVIVVVWALTGRGASSAPLPIAEMNRPAPDFTLSGLDGVAVHLGSYRNKIVLVNFWGSWCEPCKDETPALQAAYQKLRDQGLVVIGVNVRHNERAGADGDADVRTFVARYHVDYPIALDRNGDIGRAFQVYVLPTSFFIDQTGMIRHVSFSAVTAGDIEAVFQRLQQEASIPR